GDGGSRIRDRPGDLFRRAGGHRRRRARRVAPVGTWRHTDQFGETSGEGTQRRATDRETDLGDAEVAAAQQRHRALNPPRHQVAVRRFAVGEPELAAEVPGRHVRAAGERLDVQRLRVLPVDPVADAPQPREVAQVLRCGGPAGHLCILSISAHGDHSRQLARSTPGPAPVTVGYPDPWTSPTSASDCSPSPGATLWSPAATPAWAGPSPSPSPRLGLTGSPSAWPRTMGPPAG